MTDENRMPSVGREEGELKFDVGTVIFLVIGFISSWINMIIILECQTLPSAQLRINAYLSVIFTTIIPGVIIAYKNRLWGYGYMIGFSIAGIPFLFLMDLFIGGYTFFVALAIFTILWLVFWKTWRSIGTIKSSD